MRIEDEKIKLTDDQRQTLEVINKVYLGSGHGSASIMVTTPEDELNYLELRGFIFKSKGVYFPSTKGQEYLLNKLKTNLEKCESGKATREFIVHPTGVIGSRTEINKMLGNYEPEKTDTTHRLERIEELLDEVKK